MEQREQNIGSVEDVLSEITTSRKDAEVWERGQHNLMIAATHGGFTRGRVGCGARITFRLVSFHLGQARVDVNGVSERGEEGWEGGAGLCPELQHHIRFSDSSSHPRVGRIRHVVVELAKGKHEATCKDRCNTVRNGDSLGDKACTHSPVVDARIIERL